MAYKAKDSTTEKTRNLKIMFWGDTGTRKTETALRLFPNIFAIDTEGNITQCVGVPEILPFRFVQTPDPFEVVEVVDDIYAGKLKAPGGGGIETALVDSISVPYTVSQDTGALRAEERARKYKRDAASATLSSGDWGLIKRPLKRLQTRLANSPVRFIIYTARQKDLYREEPNQYNPSEPKRIKIGVCPDVMRGTESDMNLIFYFGFDAANKWSCRVDKVQGALGKLLPKGKVFTEFPIKIILEHAATLTATQGDMKGETESAQAGVQQGTAARPTAVARAPVKAPA